MSKVLDFIELDQFLPVVTLTILLAFIGDNMAAGRQSVLVWARRSAAVGLIFSAIALIEQLNPTTPSEFLVVAIRAAMAAGLCWSISTIVLAVAVSAYQSIINPAVSQHRKAAEHVRKLWDQRTARASDQRSAELADKELQRREQLHARAMRRSQRQAAIADRDRLARVQEAREEVTRFYEENAAEIQSSLPRSLFRVRLQNQLSPALSIDRIWPAAEAMIAEIVAVIDRAREEQRKADAEERRVQVLVDSIRQQIREIEREKLLFAQSPAADAEVVTHELRAFDHQIAALRDQIESLIKPKEPSP